MQLKVFGLMVELNDLRALLKRSVLYLNTNKSNHLRLRNKYCLRGRFMHYLNEGGVGPQNGHQALYISSHQPTRERISVL